MKTTKLAVVACFGFVVGCGSSGKVTVAVSNAADFNVPIGALEVRSYKVKAKTLLPVDGQSLRYVNGQFLDADDKVITGKLVDADNRAMNAAKATVLEGKGFSGKIENAFLFTDRSLSCDDGDITNWRYDRDIVTTTPGVIVKGDNGKVDIYASNQDLIFEVTAVQRSTGDGAIIGTACAILPAAKNGATVALTLQ